MSSPALDAPRRELDAVCRDEGYRARLRHERRKACLYTWDDMREAWRQGWDAADREMERRRR